MPVMDGYQTLENIIKLNLKTMVIVVSGDIQPEAHKRVKELGAVAFIKKPTSPEALSELLEKFGLYSANESKDITVPVVKKAVFKDQIGKIEYRDCIQEIANVAMGQAADLLARLLNVFVKMPIPNVNELEVSELEMALSFSENDTYSAVCQGFIGSGISGEALLLFSDSSFTDIAKLLKYEGEIDRSVELELLMEIASILVGACTNGIAQQLDTNFSQGHPVVLGQHVKVSELIKANAKRWKKTLAIEITYEIENHHISCDLLLLFTEDSLDNLNNRLAYLMN